MLIRLNDTEANPLNLVTKLLFLSVLYDKNLSTALPSREEQFIWGYSPERMHEEENGRRMAL